MDFLAATIASDLIRELYLVHQETFLRTQLHHLNRQHLFMVGSCKEEILFLHSSAKPVAQDRRDELIKDTISTPRFSRKSPTWHPPSYAEGVYPQKYMVEPKRLRISELHFGKFPTPSTCLCWKIRFKTEVCACSGSLSEAMRWSMQWTI